MDLEVIERRLREERARLYAASEQARDARRPVMLDQQSVGPLSRMDAMQGQAMAQEAERRRILRLRQIEAALERIEEDEYGACVACGGPIGDARLRNDPAVAACITCASGENSG